MKRPEFKKLTNKRDKLWEARPTGENSRGGLRQKWNSSVELNLNTEGNNFSTAKEDRRS